MRLMRRAVMVRVKIVLLCLLVCRCLVSTRARCSEEAKLKRTSEIILKLYELGDLRPDTCISEVESMKLPKRPGVPSKHSRPLVMQIAFRFISELLQKSSIPSKWKTQELQQLRDLVGLQNQCFQLEIFAGGRVGEEGKKWTHFLTSLDNFLKDKGFSVCAWEGVRPEIVHIMQMLCRSPKSQRHGLRCHRRPV